MKKQIHHVLAKTPLLMRVVSLYVVIGSVVGLYFQVSPPAEAASPVSAVVRTQTVETQVPTEDRYVSGLPRTMELPRIGLSLEVIGGDYDVATRSWTLTDDKVHFATMTSPINDKAGQTMLYGHNTSAVLEPVRHVQLGDELLVVTDKGDTFVYTYVKDKYVAPTDVAVLSELAKTPRVVLMTCEGWLSTQRRLLYFDFQEIR